MYAMQAIYRKIDRYIEIGRSYSLIDKQIVKRSAASIYLYMCVCVCVCVCVRVCRYIYTYIHIYINIYVDTYMHIYK
jgi:hypothetical protein